jgi:glycosyltransferase involved in cell wall biosynthesis
MNDLTIYLITRNRPEFALRAIYSILKQTYKEFNFIVSDNSTNDDTQNLIRQANIDDPRFMYKKREHLYHSFMDHTNAIHQEVQSQYYMIFHDDDVMLPNMVEELYTVVKTDDHIIAVGCFAFMLKNGKRIKTKTEQKKATVKSAVDIIDGYNRVGKIAAFPSYMYNKKRMNGLLMDDKKGGIYSDVSFIASLTQKGLVVHLSACLMETGVHEGQYSQSHKFSDYLSLTQYLKTLIGKDQVKRIAPMRIFNIYTEKVRRFKQDGHPLYSSKIMWLLLKYSPKDYFPKYMLRLLKIYNK